MTKTPGATCALSQYVAVSEFQLKTTGDAYTIKADVIKDNAGKSGVVQIPIHIADKDGNTVYAADNEITVSISGKAILLGLESGSSNSHEDYKASKRKHCMER